MSAEWVPLNSRPAPRVRWIVCQGCHASAPNVSSLLRGWMVDVNRPAFLCADCAEAEVPVTRS